jgi:hypothetical protein
VEYRRIWPRQRDRRAICRVLCSGHQGHPCHMNARQRGQPEPLRGFALMTERSEEVMRLVSDSEDAPVRALE